MNSEELGVQEVQCEKPVENLNVSDSLPDSPAPDQPDSDMPEDNDTECLILRKLENLEVLVNDLKKTDERYMVRKDTIDALNKTFDDSLEKCRTEITQSVIIDVANFREKYKKLCDSINKERDSESISIDNVITSFSNFSVELEQILLRQGVEIFDHTGKKYDPSCDIAQEVQSTKNEEENMQITEALSDGYSFRGRVIYQQRVKVNKYEKSVQ